MITSEFGLLELPHIAAPAGLRELHDAMYEITLPDISPIPFVFIRGVVTGGSDYADTDMMRGEETELMGLQHDGAGVYVLPGSHSKIVQTDEHGRITSFRTMLTGEMIAALSAHTILKDAVVLNAQPADRDFLLEGFRYAREHGLNDALFKVRILKNRMRRTPAEVTGFYLGAVLCDEICCILNQHPAQIILAGKKELREPMQTLLETHVPGIVVSVPDDIAGCASALGAVRIFEYQP
jgi:2-dehydro-3-deoxygalactonokinase